LPTGFQMGKYELKVHRKLYPYGGRRGCKVSSASYTSLSNARSRGRKKIASENSRSWGGEEKTGRGEIGGEGQTSYSLSTYRGINKGALGTFEKQRQYLNGG